jgi:hypothetical protein
LLQACVHLLFIDELAPISLSDTFAYSGAKTGVVFDQPKRRFLHQMLGICACRGSNLCKLRFLLSREMHFRGLESTKKPYLQQGLMIQPRSENPHLGHLYQ